MTWVRSKSIQAFVELLAYETKVGMKLDIASFPSSVAMIEFNHALRKTAISINVPLSIQNVRKSPIKS